MIRSAGLLLSFGTVGDELDNAMIEWFRPWMQIELLDRKKWKTRLELANAIFDYIETFYNRQHRHSALGYRTSINTNYSPRKHSLPLPVGHRDRNPTGGAGYGVTYPCSSLILRRSGRLKSS